jgi:CDGSH-type Zn-finger protein
MFTVTETKTYFLCGCKQTSTGPFCYTSHESVDD